MKLAFALCLFLTSVFTAPLFAQKRYAVGDAVSVAWDGLAYSGKIIQVDGDRYRVRYDGYDPLNDEWVRAQNFATKALPKGTARIAPGKYTCFSSAYNSRSGMWEYTNRGWLIIRADGSFEYLGYKEPVRGRFTTGANGVLSFKGGYLDGGKATPITRPNKFYLVFPNIIGNRWTGEPAKG